MIDNKKKTLLESEHELIKDTFFPEEVNLANASKQPCSCCFPDDRKGWVLISFYGLSKEQFEILHEIEILFHKMNITFDTGYGCGRDWEWDWSLKGPVSVIISKEQPVCNKKTHKFKIKKCVKGDKCLHAVDKRAIGNEVSCLNCHWGFDKNKKHDRYYTEEDRKRIDEQWKNHKNDGSCKDAPPKPR